jgi:hypothetical protein
VSVFGIYGDSIAPDLVDSSPWYRCGLAGLNIVVDDIGRTLADKTIDASGSFR